LRAGALRLHLILGSFQFLVKFRRGDGIVSAGTADIENGRDLVVTEQTRLLSRNDTDRFVGILLQPGEGNDHVELFVQLDAAAKLLGIKITIHPRADVARLESASALLERNALAKLDLVGRNISNSDDSEHLSGGLGHDREITIVPFRSLVGLHFDAFGYSIFDRQNQSIHNIVRKIPHAFSPLFCKPKFAGNTGYHQ
jgi:hypothetical protein